MGPIWTPSCFGPRTQVGEVGTVTTWTTREGLGVLSTVVTTGNYRINDEDRDSSHGRVGEDLLAWGLPSRSSVLVEERGVRPSLGEVRSRKSCPSDDRVRSGGYVCDPSGPSFSILGRIVDPELGFRSSGSRDLRSGSWRRFYTPESEGPGVLPTHRSERDPVYSRCTSN